ncbi:hypothetical protein H5T51_02840 [Candidatus Bathyarchaeota archaeon]|nr:hypothetical protein [Candidatus Bathyarchaeota archaeon]
MEKLELMKEFMQKFVGGGFHLIIKDENYYRVHTIEIYQKTDDSCPLKDLPIGDYFLRLLVMDKQGRRAALLCDWSPQLLQNLLKHYKYAKEAGYNVILMQQSPINPNDWIILWGDNIQNKIDTKPAETPRYVS